MADSDEPEIMYEKNADNISYRVADGTLEVYKNLDPAVMSQKEKEERRKRKAQYDRASTTNEYKNYARAVTDKPFILKPDDQFVPREHYETLKRINQEQGKENEKLRNDLALKSREELWLYNEKRMKTDLEQKDAFIHRQEISKGKISERAKRLTRELSEERKKNDRYVVMFDAEGNMHGRDIENPAFLMKIHQALTEKLCRQHSATSHVNLLKTKTLKTESSPSAACHSETSSPANTSSTSATPDCSNAPMSPQVAQSLFGNPMNVVEQFKLLQAAMTPIPQPTLVSPRVAASIHGFNNRQSAFPALFANGTSVPPVESSPPTMNKFIWNSFNTNQPHTPAPKVLPPTPQHVPYQQVRGTRQESMIPPLVDTNLLHLVQHTNHGMPSHTEDRFAHRAPSMSAVTEDAPSSSRTNHPSASGPVRKRAGKRKQEQERHSFERTALAHEQYQIEKQLGQQ